jgi:hypothetical protein
MECKDVEAVFEQEGLSPLPLEACEHLADCEGCRGLLADLSAIAVAAKRIPAEENPPERVWISLRAQLKAEGILNEPEVVEPVAAPWWQGFGLLLRPRALAMVGAGVAVAGGLYFVNRPKPRGADLAKGVQPIATQAAQSAKTESADTHVKSIATPEVAANIVKHRPSATTNPAQIHESTTVLRPSPSELASFGESAATLSQTERAVPSRELTNNAEVDATLRANLRTLNEFIAECEARLKENPRDQLTQEYLNMALQQKAELLNAMMDSGRSEH